MTVRVTAAEALQRLKDGNERFVDGAAGAVRHYGPPDPQSVGQPQSPIAIVLGCSDSRVPAEMVFDQGVGDLFVIRVAGNIVAPSQVDSVEFAASQFGTRLVVVLGHTQCGAVLAAIDEMGKDQAERSQSLRAIVDRVRPAVEKVWGERTGSDQETLVTRAVRANIQSSVEQVSKGSDGIRELIEHEGLEVIGAEYSLETGVVTFFNGADAVSDSGGQA